MEEIRIFALLHIASVLFVIKMDATINLRVCVQLLAAC